MEIFKAQSRNNHKFLKKNNTGLFGSVKARYKARHSLKSEWLEDDTWRVFGGESVHLVIVGRDHIDPRTYKCDCGAQEKSPYQVCSHMLCVYYEM